MSREESQSEMQKFRGEGLAKDMEKRNKLLAQAKNKGTQIMPLFFIVFLVLVLATIAKLFTFNEFEMEDLPLYLIIPVPVWIDTKLAGVNRRIDALIELIGEENLLKKS